MVGSTIARDRGALAAAFAGAASRYWLGVFPSVCREVRDARAQAGAISDPVLRRLALDAHCSKRGNLEGAAAFAAFVPSANRPAVVCALTAYQVIFDYLDMLAEQPCADPIANGRRLNRALLTAVQPHTPHADYYEHHAHRDDGGYLETLVDTCRAALSALPAFATIVEPVLLATKRVVDYQSLNHGDANGSHASFDRWAVGETRRETGLRWWETGAAAGSTLAVFALIAAAADPALSLEAAVAIEAVYFPWIGALHSLLDSLADQDEDAVIGERGLIDYYASPEEAADRMQAIAAQSMDRARALPDCRSHVLILAAMTSFYLCDLQASQSLHARLAVPLVLKTMGELAAPTMLVLDVRRGVGRLAQRLGVGGS